MRTGLWDRQGANTRHGKPLGHAESTIKLSCVADFDSSPGFHVDLNNLVQLYGENFKEYLLLLPSTS